MEREIDMSKPTQPEAKELILGQGREGWGAEDMPPPEKAGLIQTRWDRCVGCGACEVACAMFHYGVLNRELSRIRIFRYQLPLPKSVQNVCCQCTEEERECQKACPVDPPAIHYDEEKHHMTVDTDRCLGSSCAECAAACPAEVPRFYPDFHDHSMVCDLCERDGVRKPQCVEICPHHALEFMRPQFPPHLERIHPDDKAEYLSKRLYPLPKDKVQLPPEDIWGE